MSPREARETLQAEDIQWIEETLAEVKGVVTDGEENLLPSTVRIRLLAVVQDRYRSRSKALLDEIWKTRFQRRALAVASIALLGVVGLGWWRYLYVERVALARAWKLQNQRQEIAARTGVAIGNGTLAWLKSRFQEVEEDPTATPEEKKIWKENILRVGLQVQALTKASQDAERRLSGYSTPDRIDGFTYIRDPYTGRTLPLNATADGSLSAASINAYMERSDLFARLVATAKLYSQKGAGPLPPFTLDGEIDSEKQ